MAGWAAFEVRLSPGLSLDCSYESLASLEQPDVGEPLPG